VTVFGSRLLSGGLRIVSIKACGTTVELVSADYNTIISVANHFLQWLHVRSILYLVLVL
jgi:hypothetical protein